MNKNNPFYQYLFFILFNPLIFYSLPSHCQKYSPNDWKRHFIVDLLPYWNQASALGDPIGNFPTFRCMDGNLNNCHELDFQNLEPWILEQTDSLRRNYTRTQSRQVMLYAIGYHLTGNDSLLYYAQCGVKYLRSQIRVSGLIYPFKTSSKNGLTINKRTEQDSIHVTTQDLANSISGLAFYYYITHDKEVLDDILKVKNYIFKYYKDTDDYLKWTLCKDTNCGDYKTELAAYLDQVNSYLLLITPLIEHKATRDSCLNELSIFCKKMQTPLFFNPENSMIWAKTKCKTCLNDNFIDPLRKIGGSYHTDFGQTSRTYWNMYFAGKLLNDNSVCEFAYRNARRIIKSAFVTNGNYWATSPFEKDKKSWWLHAQLDQTTALCSLIDPNLYSEVLDLSYEFWFKNFVDHKDHEIFAELDLDNKPKPMPKIYHWKDALHPAEHLLFGYITTAGVQHKNIELYYAFNSNNQQQVQLAKPFYFDGEIIKNISEEWLKKSMLTSDFKKNHSKNKLIFSQLKAGRQISNP